jgi:hypothetical protein
MMHHKEHRKDGGKKMPAHIALAVLEPLVGKLTDAFLRKKRQSVAVAELQDQVVQMLANQQKAEVEIRAAQLAILSLTRYLAMTQPNIFVLRGDRLEISAGPNGNGIEPSIGDALSAFNASVEHQVHQRIDPATITPPAPNPSVPPRQLQKGVAPPPCTDEEALNRFFEDFDREIMRTRLGEQ